MLVLLKKSLAALVLPPTGPLLLAVAGLILRRWRPRLGSACAWAGVAVLLALSVPVVSSALTTLVCDSGPLDLQRARLAQAIVVMGGGKRGDAPEYGGDTLNSLSLERVRYAAVLARETGLPVLVTGGNGHRGRSEGELMRDMLEREYNVPVRWVEKLSGNTHENAVFSAELLKGDRISTIVLVSHGVDSRRARREFSAAGFAVVPAPTVVPTPGIDSPIGLFPSMGALQGSYLALYELLGNIVATFELGWR